MKNICQSCGMVMENEHFYGLEKDGTHSEEYCIFCYMDGKLNPEMTLDEMTELGLGFSEEYKNAKNQDEKDHIRSLAKEYLLQLKRWKDSH